MNSDVVFSSGFEILPLKNLIKEKLVSTARPQNPRTYL
jgi:hypothetical protein